VTLHDEFASADGTRASFRFVIHFHDTGPGHVGHGLPPRHPDPSPVLAEAAPEAQPTM
jgi:hypothetical protein